MYMRAAFHHRIVVSIFAVLACLVTWVLIPNAAAQPMAPQATPRMPSWRDLLFVLPRAPLGAHCDGAVVCTDMGTWGIHARLTGTLLVRDDRSVPGGMLTPAISATAAGWGEGGAQFPILLGPLGTPSLPLPVLLFLKGAFTPPSFIGKHAVLFATMTLPYGPFAAPDAKGQPMAITYEAGGAVSGHLLWMVHYDFSISGQVSPKGAPPRLLTGLELRARFDGFTVFTQLLHSAGFCLNGSADPACESTVTVLGGLQIPLVAGHTSAAAGPTRGAKGQEGTVVTATIGLSYDEITRAEYGDRIAAALKKLWVRLFNRIIDPYLDERCVLWDDDHKPMLDLGRKTADGLSCERDGLRMPIGTHFDRDQSSTRVCYDKGLRNCVLHRNSEKDDWEVVPPSQQARRPYLKDDCHVYEAGVPLPLQQVGIKSDDGKACEWQGHRFPIGTQFWAVPGDDVMCVDATLNDCSIELPEKPMTTGQYVGSRAEQGLVHGAQKLLGAVERPPQVASDLATGRLHPDTVAGEAMNTLKEGLSHLNPEDAKQKAQDVEEAGKKWVEEPLHEELGDVAEVAGEAVAGVPANLAVNAATAGVGTLVGGVTTAASDIGKTEKAIVKIEQATVKAEHLAGDAAKTEQTTVEATRGAGQSIRPTVDPRTGKEVGRFVVDPKGNTMIEPKGGSTVPFPHPGAPDTHTLYPNGSNYQRLNPNGHPGNPKAHGHGHLEGTGPGKQGQGPSIDPHGNIVPFNSKEAHWPTR